MEGMSGIETLQHLRTRHPDGLTILMTGYGTTQTTIEAMKYGAFDYVMKPFDPAKIISLVSRAVEALEEQAKARAAAARSDSDSDSNVRKRRENIELESREAGIVGNSEAMQAVIKTIGQVAASDVTVLITGESGTGKELVARQLHQHSLRVREKFIAVNCAAIPENLIESELFGHEKGSFTGAVGQKLGKFELCDRGTIFLDEIGDMALTTQTKILRALQEGEIQRVGGTESIKVNVRLVAATNKDVEKMVAAKTFREDLYYRLNVVRLRLPALRQRKGDIPLLVEFMFHRLAARKLKAKAKRLSPEALAVLADYDWPGNVRELENAIQRALIVARGETVMTSDLPPEILERTRGGVVSGHAGVLASKESAVPEDSREVDAQPLAGEAERAGEGEVLLSGGDEAEATELSESDVNLKGGLSSKNEKSDDSLSDKTAFFDKFYAYLRETTDKDILAVVEQEFILRAMKETKENRLQASILLGISRATVQLRVKQIAAKEKSPEAEKKAAVRRSRGFRV
jgi:two-component system nitrogen regulation response regulator GlnG